MQLLNRWTLQLQNLQVHRWHDVEGIGQHFVWLTPSKVKVKGKESGYLQWCTMDCCSSILLEVGIPNLVFFEWILGWNSVTYHFWVTVTLTSDILSRIRWYVPVLSITLTLTLFLELLCQEHISYIIWGRNPKFGAWMHWLRFYNNLVGSISPI